MPEYENPSPHSHWSKPPQRPSDWAQIPQKPHVAEDTLKAGSVQIERKIFSFHLKENIRGRLLRITEENGGRRNSIIIPATGLTEFMKMLDEIIAAEPQIPPGKF